MTLMETNKLQSTGDVGAASRGSSNGAMVGEDGGPLTTVQVLRDYLEGVAHLKEELHAAVRADPEHALSPGRPLRRPSCRAGATCPV